VFVYTRDFFTLPPTASSVQTKEWARRSTMFPYDLRPKWAYLCDSLFRLCSLQNSMVALIHNRVAFVTPKPRNFVSVLSRLSVVSPAHRFDFVSRYTGIVSNYVDVVQPRSPENAHESRKNIPPKDRLPTFDIVFIFASFRLRLPPFILAWSLLLSVSITRADTIVYCAGNMRPQDASSLSGST